MFFVVAVVASWGCQFLFTFKKSHHYALSWRYLRGVYYLLVTPLIIYISIYHYEHNKLHETLEVNIILHIFHIICWLQYSNRNRYNFSQFRFCDYLSLYELGGNLIFYFLAEWEATILFVSLAISQCTLNYFWKMCCFFQRHVTHICDSCLYCCYAYGFFYCMDFNLFLNARSALYCI